MSLMAMGTVVITNSLEAKHPIVRNIKINETVERAMTVEFKYLLGKNIKLKPINK